MKATDFHEYLAMRRPLLDEAFRQTVSGLLGGAFMEDAGSLAAALEGGKKLRGCLCCLVGEALGGPLTSAIPRAVAVELIQAATLIHDDFVDDDRVRRGGPATWTIEGARRAVLIGDVIFASAIKMMSEIGRQDGLAVSHLIAEMSRGALQEPLDPLRLAGEIESGRRDGRLFEKIIYLKTGILFATACQLGTISAGGNGSLQEASFRYGLRIGEAYQIADDLQEVKQHLRTRSIAPGKMAALVPAFLHFIGETGPWIPAVLKGEQTDLDESGVALFRDAASLMQREIECRLLAAVTEAEAIFPEGVCIRAVRKAPGAIIGMLEGA